MKRILLIVSFLAMFAGAAWAEKPSAAANPKLDKALADLVATSKPGTKVKVIIQLVNSPSAGDLATITRGGGQINRKFKTIRSVAVQIPIVQVSILATLPIVKHITLDHPLKTFDQTPGEPYAVTGAQLANQTYGVTGQGIGVAVIDSGIANHPDLNVAQAVDFVNPANTGGNDPFGHGTHVAGIIAGSGASSQGAYHGIAPNVNLVDLRVLDQNGAGDMSNVIAAIEWAVANSQSAGRNGQNLNIRVINLSLGYLPDDTEANDPLAQAALAAVQNGMVIVTAAGNYGKDGNGNVVYESIVSPGIEPAVITVGAMDTWGTDARSDDSVATYSSRGPTALDHFLKPDIMAPGQGVISTELPTSYLASTNPQYVIGGNYMSLCGTSMATPVVTAAVALMLQQNPALTPNAVKAALMFTAEAQPSVVNGPITVGAGYLNTAGAVNLAASINTSAPSGQNWISNPSGLDYSEVIAGYPAVWSQSLQWGSNSFASNAIMYNAAIWGQTVVWDDTTVWDDTIVWADTIIWDDTVIAADTIVWDDTIVWADTIVWGETVVHQN